MPAFDSPRLLADIDGEDARFVLETGPGEFTQPATLRCADHADFAAAVRAYLSGLGGQTPPIHHAAAAISASVEGDRVRMTNDRWQLSIDEVRRHLGLDTLAVVNDFTALAMALPRLAEVDVRQIGGGQARRPGVIGLLRVGPALGVSGLIPAGEGWITLGAGGGQANFGPRDERELDILKFAWKHLGQPHVCCEHLISDAGLALIYRALADREGAEVQALTAAAITQRALDEGDALCLQTLEVFCGLLGTAAANLAMTLGALGGIYLGGSLVPRLGDWFDRSPFRARFGDNGGMGDGASAIATFVITAEHATFKGASAILDNQLRQLQAAPGTALLGQIHRARSELSRAELRVADLVLAQPRSVLNDPIAEIARAAGVSQPTVIRFCRSLGCEGLSDFKLRLASGLSGTVPVTHTPVNLNDSMLELGAKVLGNTASAILQLRSHLNRSTLDRATEMLRAASRVEVFASGQDGVVAEDAQFKFLRLGRPCATHTDPRLQALAADLLREGDMAVVISSGGRLPELISVVEKAQQRGAKVVAITASQSPLARKADVALIVDHVEDIETQLPMVSRILQLLIIDMLTVGVARRRGLDSVAASPLARLTSHSR